MSAIIFINDNNIVIQQSETVSRTQGYARIVDGDIHFDFNAQEPALDYCRLQPQQIQNRYWQQCAQHSINVEHKEVRNSADLIWQHLKLIREHYKLTDVVFVVPSHYQQDNLQLLLGIAESTGLKPQGLINSAVLAAQEAVQNDGYYTHVDFQLHQTVCSLIEVKQGVAKLKDVDVLSQVSIQVIYDAILKAVQQQFIQSDRFDPMHYAETEQQLFNQIIPVAKSLSEVGKSSITIQHNMHSYSVAVDNTQWNSVLQPFVNQINAISKTNQSNGCLLQLNRLFGNVTPAPFQNENTVTVESKVLVINALVDAGNSQNGLSYKLELPLINYRDKSQNDKLRSDIGGANLSKQETLTSNEVGGLEKSNKSIKPVYASKVTHLMQAGVAIPLNRANIELIKGELQLRDSETSNLKSVFDSKQLFILNDSDRQELELNDRLGSHHGDGVIIAIQVIA